VSWVDANRDDTLPAEDGWYVVWRMADEGEDHAPAEWMGVEPWLGGSWEQGDWGVVKYWDQPFATMAEAEAAERSLPRP
jgi:hypothetical protein